MSDFQLAQKRAIVTGGASGIGAAITAKFAQKGAEVHVLDMGTPSEELSKMDGVHFYTCDVSDQVQVEAVVTEIAAKGGIDILVNNAGVAHIGNAENTNEADFDRVTRINVKGVYNCLHACLPHLKKTKGTIVNMASIAASLGISDRFAYSMSKGAVLAMTYSVAKDFLADGIRCNSISPARIHTPFVDGFLKNNYPGREEEMFQKLSQTQPIGRMGTPEEVANLALFLCSGEAAFITGTDFPIDGGFIKLNG